MTTDRLRESDRAQTGQTRVNFSDLGLSREVLRAVADAGYIAPTPIQEQAIPVVLTGRDMLGGAQTGTGKTASFTLPMIDILATGRVKARMARSLILEPTRELAMQVATHFEIYGKYHRLSKALLIGGTSINEQERVLDPGVDVLIATPGRFLDLFERGRILLADVKILVIDEADRMLDMGFIPDVERIVSLLPRIRQTLLFTATMPPEIRRLAAAFLINPKAVAVDPPAHPAEKVSDVLVTVAPNAKREALRRLLRSEKVKSALIFCNRKRDVDTLCDSLQRYGFSVAALHGDMPQARRTATLAAFRRKDIPLLVASDVAGRGLDIKDMSHVFNFDVPINPEDYVHRIGRTGRAGLEGRAFTLATPEDGKYIAAIARLIRRDIPRIDLPGLSSVELDSGKVKRRRRRRKSNDRAGAGRETRPEARPDPAARARETGRVGGGADPGKGTPPGKSRPPGESRPVASAGARGAKAQREPARRARHGRKPDRGGKPDRDSTDDAARGKTPAGLGDHVPAFLLQPPPAIRRKKP
ncbi:MAG: DEAD/DEAH box helicase [Proteobacteria bacterium]|nr:DEAD/DEAH box helicase [Pseudomonadota bacterium]